MLNAQKETSTRSHLTVAFCIPATTQGLGHGKVAIATASLLFGKLSLSTDDPVGRSQI